MSDSIADTAEESEMTEVDFDGLEQGSNPTPDGQEVGQNGNNLVDFLKSKSPQKELEDYQGHTLDFDGSESTRRLIRGIEGLLGEANYAIADLVIGFAQKLSDLGSPGEEDENLRSIDGVQQ